MGLDHQQNLSVLPIGRPNYSTKFQGYLLTTFAIILHRDGQNDRKTNLYMSPGEGNNNNTTCTTSALVVVGWPVGAAVSDGHWSAGFRRLRAGALGPPSGVSAVAGAVAVHVPARPEDASGGRRITAVASQRRCDIA